MTPKRLFALALAATLILAACGGKTDAQPSPSDSGPPTYAGWPPVQQYELIPVPVSSEIAVGPNRLLLNLIDNANQSQVSADRPVALHFYDVATDPVNPVINATTTYMPTREGLPGLYRSSVTFPKAGDWGVEAITTEADGNHRIGRMIFSVREESSTPAIGAQAPSSDTPTASTPAEIATISTDPTPDPDFYRDSIASALAAHKPFLLIFATPAFCQSATCGPALDIVQTVAADYKAKMTFIHVEPYELDLVDGHLRPVLDPNNLPTPVASVIQYGLPTEPYIFVVDSAGKVTAKFEGIAAPDEIRAALDAIPSRGPGSS